MHVYHFTDFIIPLVNAEDLVIMKIILRPVNDHKNEDRANILKYDHFSILYNGTISFCEAEVCDILCNKHHFYF